MVLYEPKSRCMETKTTRAQTSKAKESIPRHLKAGICAVQSRLDLHLFWFSNFKPCWDWKDPKGLRKVSFSSLQGLH